MARTAVKPRQQIFGAVVGVQDDGHAILLGHGANVVRARHSAGDRRLEVGVVQALARVELRAARRELNNDRCVGLARGLEARVDRRRGDAVDGRDRVAALLRERENEAREEWVSIELV